MYEAVKNFAKQFEYEPKIKNAAGLKKTEHFIVLGMGGSHLTADLLEAEDPYLDIIIHKNYGLPKVSKAALERSLIVASSYSGNTEEVIDGFQKAADKKLSIAAVATGGQLIELARERKVPHIKLPETGIQPRSALGFSIKGLAKLMGLEEAFQSLGRLAKTLHPEEYEERGKKLAAELKGKVPIIYSSARNEAVAYNWKIKFNETGKIPAFYNVFPELNHNEMTGFDIIETTRSLSKNFYFIILRDKEDHPKIQKRMEVLARLYQGRKLPVEILELRGGSRFYKIFSSLVLADWTAYYAAESYGAESEQVPMVEEFKKLI